MIDSLKSQIADWKYGRSLVKSFVEQYGFTYTFSKYMTHSATFVATRRKVAVGYHRLGHTGDGSLCACEA